MGRVGKRDFLLLNGVCIAKGFGPAERKVCWQGVCAVHACVRAGLCVRAVCACVLVGELFSTCAQHMGGSSYETHRPP